MKKQTQQYPEIGALTLESSTDEGAKYRRQSKYGLYFELETSRNSSGGWTGVIRFGLDASTSQWSFSLERVNKILTGFETNGSMQEFPENITLDTSLDYEKLWDQTHPHVTAFVTQLKDGENSIEFESADAAISAMNDLFVQSMEIGKIAQDKKNNSV